MAAARPHSQDRRLACAGRLNPDGGPGRGGRHSPDPHDPEDHAGCAAEMPGLLEEKGEGFAKEQVVLRSTRLSPTESGAPAALVTSLASESPKGRHPRPTRRVAASAQIGG